MKKHIAIVGATGAQGGGLVRAIFDDVDGKFAVRAITRNIESEAAKAIAANGGEVVVADLDDQSSLERALAGAHGAFFVTNFWEHFSPVKEREQARNLARAARSANVGHVVWSTLEDTRLRVPLSDERMPTLMGNFKVPHFDGKGEADAYFEQMVVPTTYLRTSFYWENFIFFGMEPKPGNDGVLRLALPLGNARLPGIAAEDIGRCAYGIFKEGNGCVGKTIGIAGESLTGLQMAEAMSAALGREVRYSPMTPEAYRQLGFAGADDLGNMFQYKQEFEKEFCGARDVGFSKLLNPRLQQFAQWLRINASRIPIRA
jgi:uncharacterized protein YbjT (DUF2867 family)